VSPYKYTRKVPVLVLVGGVLLSFVPLLGLLMAVGCVFSISVLLLSGHEGLQDNKLTRILS